MLPGDMSKRKPPQQGSKFRRLTSAWPDAGRKVPVSVAELFAVALSVGAGTNRRQMRNGGGWHGFVARRRCPRLIASLGSAIDRSIS